MSAVGRTPAARVTLPESGMGPAFTAYGLRSTPTFPLDPFINLDDFRMSQPTFPPHPHAGFSAVTYMFEDSPGAFTNRDSLGDRSRIGPGSLHWTQAARGMMHEEVPEAPGTVCHGVQMFVNLRAGHKQAPPRAFHLDAADVPVVEAHPGVRVRVLVGSVDGVHSPLTELLTPVLLLDVQLQPGARAQIPVRRGWNGFLLSVSGAGGIGPAGAERPVVAHEGHGFRDDGDHIELVAGAAGLQVLVAGGAPIGEPLVFGGPFAGTSREEVEAAVARYQRGEMGRLARSF